MELKVTPWLGTGAVSEVTAKELLEEQSLKVYRWSKPSGDIHTGHTHSYHKVLYVIKGSIRFDLPTHHETINLQAGDRLDLPAGFRHNAVVGTEGVICLEAHIY
jgi:quercetin dioxygenase-like cupin family protein